MAKMKAGKNLLPVEKGKMVIPHVSVLGVGGAGGKTLSRLAELEPQGVRLVTIHTNKAQLNTYHPNLIKILIGRTLTQGMGSYGSTDVGARAVEISQESLNRVLKKTDLVFMVSGMGGGTGSGATYAIAETAKKQGAFVVAFTTYPHDMERKKQGTAEDAIVSLTSVADSVVVLDANRVQDLFPGIKLEDMYTLLNEIMARTIYNIVDTMTQPALINLDFTDVKEIFSAKGISMMTMGSSSQVNEIVEKTLESTLLNSQPNHAKSVLITMTGGTSFDVAKANQIGEMLTKKINPSIIAAWGCRIDPDFTDEVEVMALFMGINSPFKGGRVEAEEGKTSSVGSSKYAIRGKDGKIKKGMIEV